MRRFVDRAGELGQLSTRAGGRKHGTRRRRRTPLLGSALTQIVTGPRRKGSRLPAGRLMWPF